MDDKIQAEEPLLCFNNNFNNNCNNFIAHKNLAVICRPIVKSYAFSFAHKDRNAMYSLSTKVEYATDITLQHINLYLEQPMEIQLFATFFQRRK
jgi:hypothetical protein